MKAFLARDLLKLNDCGCCEGITYRTPVGVFNRAGLAAIAYRVGTHDQFKQSLLAQLSRAELPALQALTTRDEDDFAIALLDAWATVADVLTFYQERIAQESYLRTATERLSMRELARLIGYQLRPGVAASTPLAFTLDTAPTSPPQITLAAGTKVQSIPGKDEQAQMFETVSAIAARAAWNAMRPRLTQPQTAASLQQSLTVQGTATRIQQGDKLLIVYPDSTTEPDFVTVFRVTVNQDAGTTRLDLVKGSPPQLPTFSEPTFPVAVMPTGAIALNQAAIQNQIIGKSWSQKDLVAFTEVQDWHQADLTASVMSQLTEIDQPAEVYVFRLTAAVFGYNAAKKVVYLTSGDNVGKPDTSGGELKFTEWQPADDELDDILFLDNAYKEITEDSYVAIRTISSPIDDLTAGALETNAFGLGAPILATLINTTNNTTNNLAADSITDAPNTTLNSFAETASVKSYRVETVLERSRTAYGLSGKTTQITLNQAWWNHNANSAFGNTIRKATVYAQSEQLTLAALPITDTVAGNTITLDGFYLGLQPGQLLILSGERHDLEGVTQSETLTLKDITIQSGYTQITLQAELAHPYKRNTVTINANVAPATHGETVQEILGSGDASQPYQAFNLRQPPLTYVSSDAAPSGALSTLEVRVNDIRWHEAPMLYGQKPSDRIYMTRQTEDGKTEVKFGDGKTGARLLTGTNNVEATYRKGIGLAGNVKANQLTALMSRPLGLKAVTNPLPATGGEDGEVLADARQNAPLTVLTLDRAVSLQDYEDFARAFGGIAKALATWTWMGQRRGVFVTVAGPQGAAIEAKLIDQLMSQLRQSGDPYVPLLVKTYRKALFKLRGNLKVDADYQSERVLGAVKDALKAAFSFEARAFGQGVALSEVLAVIQAVPGVVHVDIDELNRDGSAVNGLHSPLPSAVPLRQGNNLLSAELLTLDPASFDQLGELP